MKFAHIVFAAGLVLCFTHGALADIRVPGQPYKGPARRSEAEPTPPGNPPEPPAPAKVNDKAATFVVKLDAKAQDARLQIPKKFVATDAPAAEKKTSLFSPESRSVIAGLALSAGIVSLLLFPRWKSSTRVTAATVAGFLLIAGTFGIAWGNAPNPYRDRPEPPVNKEKVVVEVVADGDTVTLTLSPDAFARIQKSVNGN